MTAVQLPLHPSLAPMPLPLTAVILGVIRDAAFTVRALSASNQSPLKIASRKASSLKITNAGDAPKPQSFALPRKAA